MIFNIYLDHITIATSVYYKENNLDHINITTSIYYKDKYLYHIIITTSIYYKENCFVKYWFSQENI